MRALICDFGNVVAFFDHRRACEQLAALSDSAATADDVWNGVFSSGLEHQFDLGSITTRQFLNSVRAAFRLRGTDSDLARAWCDIFTPNLHVVNALPGIKGAFDRRVLASNTNALHYSWFHGMMLGSLECFPEHVLSFQIHARKPDIAFFARCHDVTGVQKSDCVFVDDRADFVEAAGQFGFATVRYDPSIDLELALNRSEQS